MICTEKLLCITNIILQTNKQTNKDDQQIKGNSVRNYDICKVLILCQGQPCVIACPWRRKTSYTTD